MLTMRVLIKFFLLAVFCHLAEAATTMTTTGGELSNFSFARCSEPTPISSFEHVTSFTDCQARCSADSRCGFFVWSRQAFVCSLIKGSIDEFVSTCRQVSGPSNINYQDWLDDKNSCKVPSVLFVVIACH